MVMNQQTLLPASWAPKAAGDQVLANLTNVCLPTVKGAHDSDCVIVDGTAYIVYEANDVQPGEAANWPFIYCAMSIVDIATGTVERVITFAAGEMRYDNVQLPVGACFVPHVLHKDARTVRCFFASEDPDHRQSQVWFIDFDIPSGTFAREIFPAELATEHGVFPMEPQHFYRQAVTQGFTGTPDTFGLYLVDSFKHIDGRIYAVLNNFPGGHNALSELNAEMNRFTVLGNFFLPHEAKLTEAAVNRLPDGRWRAIARQENRNQNYMFADSPDGRTWSPHTYRPPVVNGTNSKPLFEHFGDVYYLGWNEATQIAGVSRSVFNVEVSRDGETWERAYRFETEKSFQYPTFREYHGTIYLTVTHGDDSDSRKERIMFGKLAECL